MKQLLSLLIAISLGISAYADDCSKPVTPLEKGAQSPCKGFLFSPNEEEKAHKTNEDNKLLTQELNIKDEYINTYKKDSTDFESVIAQEQQKSELWRNAAESSTEKLVKMQSGNMWEHVLWFAAGVVTTSLAVWGAGQLRK